MSEMHKARCACQARREPAGGTEPARGFSASWTEEDQTRTDLILIACAIVGVLGWIGFCVYVIWIV